MVSSTHPSFNYNNQAIPVQAQNQNQKKLTVAIELQNRNRYLIGKPKPTKTSTKIVIFWVPAWPLSMASEPVNLDNKNQIEFLVPCLDCRLYRSL